MKEENHLLEQQIEILKEKKNNYLFRS